MGDGDDKGQIPKLLTAEELARQLEIPISKLYRLGRTGGLPTVHIGGAVRFLPSEVTRWLEAGGSKPTRRPRRRPVIDEGKKKPTTSR